jgi:O-antigen/teichoic acid export membrane protein
MGKQLRKAIRAIYGLLIPALIVLVPAAGFIMNFFGPAYGALATETFRILALTALVGSCNYLVDSMLIARDRSGAYLFMNGANALLVLVCVGFLLPRGLAWGAVGWAIGQAASLALGIVVVVLGRTGQHRRRRGQAADAPAQNRSAGICPGGGRIPSGAGPRRGSVTG